MTNGRPAAAVQITELISMTGMSPLFSLTGQRALITGSGQGIGFTLARGLGEAGAELVLNDIDPALVISA